MIPNHSKHQIQDPEIVTSSIDWAELNNLLPEDGDRVQSAKRCFQIKNAGRRIMSKKSIIASNSFSCPRFTTRSFVVMKLMR
jgi:hypothetical protein